MLMREFKTSCYCHNDDNCGAAFIRSNTMQSLSAHLTFGASIDLLTDSGAYRREMVVSSFYLLAKRGFAGHAWSRRYGKPPR